MTIRQPHNRHNHAWIKRPLAILGLLAIGLWAGPSHAVEFDWEDRRVIQDPSNGGTPPIRCFSQRDLTLINPLIRYPSPPRLEDIPIGLMARQEVQLDGVTSLTAADLVAADIARGCDYPEGLACGLGGCKRQDSWNTGGCGPAHRRTDPGTTIRDRRDTGCQVERTPVRKREYWEQDE